MESRTFVPQCIHIDTCLLHDHPIGARYIPRKFLDGTHFVFLIHNPLFDLCSDSQPKIPIRDSDMYPCTMSSHRNAPKIFLLVMHARKQISNCDVSLCRCQQYCHRFMEMVAFIIETRIISVVVFFVNITG